MCVTESSNIPLLVGGRTICLRNLIKYLIKLFFFLFDKIALDSISYLSFFVPVVVLMKQLHDSHRLLRLIMHVCLFQDSIKI